jgi:ubiquinone/menaquinone biosynthesis C-methylase UbiE
LKNKLTHSFANLEDSFESYSNKRISHWETRRDNKFQIFSNQYHQNLSRIYKNIIPKGSRILEIGCGNGNLLASLEGSYSVGVDFSDNRITFAKREYPQCVFFKMDAHSLDLPTNDFDFIILSDLLNDVWDVQKILQEIGAYCKKETRVVCNVYSHLWNIPLSFARLMGLASPQLNQNWLTKNDLSNFFRLSNFQPLNYWQEILTPFPIFNSFFNRYLVKIFPFNHLALSNFLISRFKVIPIPSKPAISIIIPARNESGHIQELLRRLPSFPSEMEVIFVEGNSTDDTYNTINEEIKNFPNINCKLFKQTGKGKGDAVRLGFDNAKNEILMILDADMTVPPEDLLKFYNLISTGDAEFVNGVRLIYPMEEQAMRFLNLLGNKFFSFAFSWLLGQPIRDTLCGTKVLRKSDYQRIIANRAYFGNFDPFGDFDLLFGAAKLNLKILEIPIRYRARKYGETNISRWSHGWLLLKMVVFAARKIKFT